MVKRCYCVTISNRHRFYLIITGRIHSMRRTGALFCLASAVGFGAMGVFGKLAYEHGATVGTLLAVRFVIAAVILWAVVLAAGRLAELRALPRRDVGAALALGAIGYSLQAGGYFAALQRIDPALLGLLLYTFPVMVTVAAIALGREQASGRTACALALSCSGIVLVLAGAAHGALDPLGTVLGLAAAVVYSAYILVSEGVTARVSALALSTLVCTGAATTLTVAGLLGTGLDLGAVSTEGLGWIAAIALVSTVGAVGLFFAGLARVGPSAASILSTLEPVVTVVLAFVAFGTALGPAQLAGGALVLAAAVVVQTGRRHQTPGDEFAAAGRSVGHAQDLSQPVVRHAVRGGGGVLRVGLPELARRRRDALSRRRAA
jgi:drug/metabolite transporter (DMT)-like permease